LILIFIPVFVYAGETRQFTLDNGMVVILKENHSTPMVSSIVCVRAGSKFEDDSNNGFTHFLEHLLFNGTKQMTRLELNEGIKDHGGYINAFTTKELTGYLFVIPAEFAEFGLQAQSQQLFHSTLPEEEFPKERMIVTEEIRKEYDNVNYLNEMYFDSLIYRGTPYEQTVLGHKDVIASLPRENIYNYYKERYVPNNMIALFIGDFEIDEFARLVNQYYGSVDSGKLLKRTIIEVDPEFSREVHTREAEVDAAEIHMVFKAPRFDDPDYYAVDMLVQILDSGESSPLYKYLTKSDDPLVSDMSVYLESNSDFSLLHFTASANDPEKVEHIVATTSGFLATIGDQPFDKKRLERIVTRNKTDRIYLEEKLHYYGIMQAPMLVNFGYGFIRDYVKNLSDVEPSDIQNSAVKCFADRQYLALATLPVEKEDQ